MDGLALLLLVAVGALTACPPVRAPAPDDDDATPDATPDPAAPRCAIREVLPASCVEVPTEPLPLIGWCEVPTPPVARVVTTAEDWRDVLATCDQDTVDPLADNDWSRTHVVGTMAMAGGCNGSAGTSFLARCDDGHHLAYWSLGCGACNAVWTTTHWVTVSAEEGVAALSLDVCVPDGVACGP